jgi:RNA polymerase sigma-70 factor, ECF subfamily
MADGRAREDRRLAERIGAGDAGALEALYDAHAVAVYRQALAVLGSTADAEDVVQEVFLNMVRRRGGPITDVRAYLLTAARHQACSILRERRRDEEGQPLLVERPSRSDDPAEAADRHVVRQALLALPAEQRQVVMLRIYEQLTFEEIGRAVKVSLNTVASRYRYALKKLRQALGDTFHG